MNELTLSHIKRERSEAACRRLGQAFVAHLDTGNYDSLGGIFTADGIVQRVSGEILRGREEIVQSLRRPTDQIALHHASPVHVEIVGEGDAIGVCSFLAFLAQPVHHQTMVRVAAIWHDRYRFDRGEWLISERRADVRMSGQVT